jgi:hypothetical protein
MNIPVFSATIDESLDSDLEINFVALVNSPAIERNFHAFAERAQFAITNADRRIVSGPLMIADQPIYRNSPTLGEYYIVFSADEIYKMAKKFFAKGYQSNLNIEHNGTMVVDGATMFESWITDPERGVMPMKGYEDAPAGSWFGSFTINNDLVWAGIKDGLFKGFSIEGVLSAVPYKLSKEAEMFARICEVLKKVAV